MIIRRLTCALTAAVLATMIFAGCSSAPKDSIIVPETTPAATEPAQDPTEAPETTAESTEAPSTVTEGTTAEATTAEAETTTVSTAAPETTPAPTTVTASETAAETFAVEQMNAKMYALADVNVRKGPDPSYERMGHLDEGDEVEVTGRCENGWYRIKFKGGEYFVGGSYLSETKPAVTTAATTTAAAATAAKTEKTEESKKQEVENTVKKTVWVETWGTAILTPTNEDEQIPKNPSLENSTLRQQIRVSMGGETLRLTISNEHGSTDLEIESITIAKLKDPKSSAIDTSTIKALTLDGNASFKVPSGKRITTDALEFEFDPLTDLAITMKLGKAPSTMTTLSCHTASRCSTWVTSGNHVNDESLSGGKTMTAWYYICGLDTLAEPGSGAIVCLGDSLTDGASVTTNAFARYTDELARQLQADSKMKNLSVVNMGIGATALYIYGGDIAGSRRANRDVLKVPGVKYCVLLMGVNDIGAASSDISGNIISEYKSLIERCHKNGIKIYGCTITPFKGNGYYSTPHESIRKTVNNFIKSSASGFDGYIDLAAAVASADDEETMDKKYVSVWNDNLHFNDGGYKYVGKTVYEHLKEFISKEK